MTFEVRITETAQKDLEEIFDYISVELQNPLAADRILTCLEGEILGLDTMPERFRLYPSEPWHSRGLRVMKVEHYLVFYLTDKEENTVTVIRVMYGGRDTETELHKNT